MNRLMIRINVDIREYTRLKEIEEKYEQLIAKKEGHSSGQAEKNDELAHVTQFGSGSLQYIENLVNSAVEKALSQRKKGEEAEIKYVTVPDTNVVEERQLNASALQPKPPPEIDSSPIPLKKKRWYYLGSADSIISDE